MITVEVLSKFSEKRFFSDSSINTVLDRIYYEVNEGVDITDLNSKICITGRAAAIWQGHIPERECDNVILITNDLLLYTFIQVELPSKIKHQGVSKFKERTLFYFESFFLEIWYQEGDVFSLISNEIYVQRAGAINPILL